MKILSIGNSFSQDSQRYLQRLAKKDGVDLHTVNLYIGGCSLRTHYLNALDDKMEYSLELNGVSTMVKVSIKQVLESVEWDVITLQQVSYLSPRKESFSPYIEELNNYVKKYNPHAKIYIHQVWPYEDGSDRIESTSYKNAKEMFELIKLSYDNAKALINADGLIPSGTAMYKAVELGIGKIHRDGFHASLGAGRYLLALTWYKALTGADVSKNDFNEFDEPVTDKEREIVIKAVNYAVK